MANQNDELVVLAHQCYVKKDYSGAQKHLNELEPLVDNESLKKRVQHNKLLVEFTACNFKQVTKYKKLFAQLAGVEFPETDVTDVSPFVLYNYAVILYHLKYYFQCTVLLEDLLTSGNIKDTKLQCRVVLLLLEGFLCRRMFDKGIEIANSFGEVLKSNKEVSDLFERLVCRAQVSMGQKINLKLDSIENVFIIAHQQYLSGDVKEAANTLGMYRSLKYNYDYNTQGEDIWAAVNNNLGVIYLSIKKPHIALKYFQNAIKEHFKSIENGDNDWLIVCKDRPLYVYNLGIALHAANNTERAFECLVEVARHYPNNARIWLRLAECCVKKCCTEEAQQFTVKKLGSGAHTRVLLAREVNENYSSGESFAIPSMSLEFAALCLRNALTLVPDRECPADVTAPLIRAPPGPPINWKQRCELKNAVLVLQSYILLQLQDPFSALVSANELLSQPDLSNSHKAWAHMYASEALVCLDKSSDAMDHLNPAVIHELTSSLPYSMRDIAGVSVWAKAAVCHILRGDLVTAKKILQQINSPRILPLQMYVEICTGNIENCHNILRKLRINMPSQ